MIRETRVGRIGEHDIAVGEAVQLHGGGIAVEADDLLWETIAEPLPLSPNPIESPANSVSENNPEITKP